MKTIKSPPYKHRPKRNSKKAWDPYTGKYVIKTKRATCYHKKKWQECSKKKVKKHLNDKTPFEIRNLDGSLFKIPKDPYKTKRKPKPNFKRVCAIKYDKKSKKNIIKTYKNKKAAKKSNALITHIGECGACSTFKDLGVYMNYFDITDKVRKCTLKGIFSKKQCIKCLKNLGFTDKCAEIWFENTKNTRKKCFRKCIIRVLNPHNNKNGSMNECIKCDEEISGPIFQKYAGRTRRNSTLRSAIYRDEVLEV